MKKLFFVFIGLFAILFVGLNEARAGDILFEAEVKAKQPMVGSFDYAFNYDGWGLMSLDGSPMKINYDVDAAFAAAIGYRFDSGAQFMASYEYFSADDHERHLGLVAPTLMRPGLFLPRLFSFETQAHIAVGYDIFDLTFGQNFETDSGTTFNMNAGLRAIWLSNVFQAHYKGCFFVDTTVRHRIHSEAYGITLNGNVHVPVTSFFGVFGGTDLSLMYSSTHYWHYEHDQRPGTLVNSKEHIEKILMMVSLEVGIEFLIELSDDLTLMPYVSYEIQLLLDVVETSHKATLGLSPTTSDVESSLGIHGIIFGLRCDF